MAAVKYSPYGNGQFSDANGDPAVGWKIYTYVAGSSTPQTTYTTSTGNVSQTNPIVIDSLGFITTGQLWLISGQSYKLVLTDQNDVVKDTQDNISGVNDTSSTVSQWQSSGLTPTYVSTTSFTVSGDQTTELHVGRRLQFTTTSGTVYGVIATSAYTTLTTVTLTMDSGQTLDSGLSVVNLSILRADHLAVPDIYVKNTGNTTAVSLKDSLFTLQDNADPTKLLAFELSGITTGNTRTLTIPDKSGTVAMTSDIVMNNIVNLSLSASVSGNALTIELKGQDGNNPSSTNVVKVPFRNVTATAGDYTILSVTAATSIVISSGSTLGSANNTPFKGWVVAFNDAGTFRLGVINCLSSTAGIYPLAQFGIASSTAEGGAGAADSVQTFYTGTAVTSKAYTILGYFSYETALATAGTYASTPARLELFRFGVPLPGARVQRAFSQTGAYATGSTAIPLDDTIPQISEGNLFLSKAITPTSTSHWLDITAKLQLSPSSGGGVLTALFQDSTANAIAAAGFIQGSAQGETNVYLHKEMLAGTTSSTTFSARAGMDSASAIYFNGRSSARIFGGVYDSYIAIEEIAT